MKLFLIISSLFLSFSAFSTDCSKLPKHTELLASLKKIQSENNGGLGFHMWATLVNREGIVCDVTFSGGNWDSQWIGSRIISAQKAYTANAFSLPQFSISTSNLYSAVQPGGSLFGLQESNPVNTNAAYNGDAKNFGTPKDSLIGKRMGGINVFGGGLALYNSKGEIVGALGLSGDTSCADHVIAWKLRNSLNLDYVPAGVSSAKDDNIIYLSDKETPNGFKHPTCGGKENQISLPATSKI